jgi:glycosyltransferase involved in cell wall biosynthesis
VKNYQDMNPNSYKLQATSYKLKTALIYDKVNTFGGAERVLFALHQLFPQAPLYTSVYHPSKAPWAKVFPQIIPSFLQHFPFARTHPQWYTPLMPLAFETLDLSHYDLVISVTSGETKGVITKPETLHLCYCLTPPRYLWIDPGYSSYQHFGLFNPLVNLTKPFLLPNLQAWDQVAASRPDAYATTSQTVARRIQEFYHRSAKVIHPLVDTNFFKPAETKPQNLTSNKNSHSLPVTSYKLKNRPKDYFLLVSRLVPYKKVDLAIRAFQQLSRHPEFISKKQASLISESSQIPGPSNSAGRQVRNDFRLKIVGTGPDLPRLKRLAKRTSTVKLLGHISEKHLLSLYQRCQALIMPQEEDFGLVALEAMACGKPVIAFQKGGATETVIDQKTGLFFSHQTPDSLISAVKKFKSTSFSPQACRAQAAKFSLDNFQNQMAKWISSQIKKIL